MTPSLPPNKRRGAPTAVLVVAGLVLVAALGAGVVLWRAGSSTSNQQVLSALGQGIQLAKESSAAPGVAEAKAAGCEDAMAMNVGSLLALTGAPLDGGKNEQKLERTWLMCFAEEPFPECDALALVYAAAPGRPPGTFILSVRKRSEKGDRCTRRYDDSGKYLGEADL